MTEIVGNKKGKTLLVVFPLFCLRQKIHPFGRL